jgi:DNA-binding transcriptional MerR regulator
MKSTDLIPIGEIARRTGLSVSAIRFYEARGLVTSLRSHGNQRRFARGDIRRLSFILIAQKLGLGLAEIEAELARLPQGRNLMRASRCWCARGRSSTNASVAAASACSVAGFTTRTMRPEPGARRGRGSCWAECRRSRRARLP